MASSGPIRGSNIFTDPGLVQFKVPIYLLILVRSGPSVPKIGTELLGLGPLDFGQWIPEDSRLLGKVIYRSGLRRSGTVKIFGFENLGVKLGFDLGFSLS